MSIHISRDRIERPMLSAITIGDFHFDGLTCNNIIVCNSLELATELSNKLMSLKSTDKELILGLWDENLLKLNDEEFSRSLYNPEYHLDGIIIEREFDRIKIQFMNYAVQYFYITNCPSIVKLAISKKDVWFVNEDECIPFTAYKKCDEIFEDKDYFEKKVREGRYLMY